MDLKKLLRAKGMSNDIIKAVEKKTAEITEMQEMECREKAAAMTRVMLNEALRSRKNAGPTDAPVDIKKMIIGD